MHGPINKIVQKYSMCQATPSSLIKYLCTDYGSKNHYMTHNP